MSKIFKGGTNLIFHAGSKALDLSEVGCLPKPAILIHVHAQQPLSQPVKVPFHVLLLILNHAFLALLLILIHAIHELPLTQPVLTLELAQVVHPVMLSQHRELFELQLPLLRELFELLHVLIAVLHAKIHILTSKLQQFPQLGFPLPRRLGRFRHNGP